MSIDDLRTIRCDAPIETDLCLVGSGPAGWVIAEELRNSGLRMLMLESGGQAVDPDVEALSRVEDVGTPLFNGRARVLGGTSRVWGGRCIPLDDIDYERRSWVPRSGWPLDGAALARDVNRAAEHLGACSWYDGAERRPAPEALAPRPNVEPTRLRQACWENPPLRDFGHLLRTRRVPNLWVLLRATVTQLDTDPSGRRVRSVEVADADGRRLTVRARAVVLCAGGIENARLMLCSDRVDPRGLGNAHDLVGRHLMDHPRDFALIAGVGLPDADRFRDLFGPYQLDNARGRHEFNYGFTLSPDRQRAEGLLNTAAWPYEVWSDDDPFQALRRLVQGHPPARMRDAWRVVSQPRRLLRDLSPRLLRRQPVRRKVERIGFLVTSEQVPDPDSRVRLGEGRDRLGVRVARTDWRVGELEARSQAALAQAIAEEFARLGLPRIRLADWVQDRRFDRARFVDGCHPSGTTRMSADARSGVVDADCQVHGVDGLFVAGSSVFPTNGHANPTLMIAALAVRLSRHLRQRLAAPPGAAPRPAAGAGAGAPHALAVA